MRKPENRRRSDCTTVGSSGSPGMRVESQGPRLVRRRSAGLKDGKGGASDDVFDSGAAGEHVGCVEVAFKVIEAFPLFDDGDDVGAGGWLGGDVGGGVDGGAVFDTTVLGPDGFEDGGELSEQFVAAARVGQLLP